jgi:hypothetical protein
MAQNWKIHKTLAFIAMAFVVAVLLGIKGITMADELFNLITFKWIAIVAQAYAAWVWYSLVRI